MEDRNSVRSSLRNLGKIAHAYTKRDHYYGKNDRYTEFRLRYDRKSYLVTRKERTVENGIERNREIEFGVDDPVAFDVFARSLGYREIISKVKRVEQFTVALPKSDSTILAELCEVERLGNFLELEIILPEDSQEESINTAKGRLLELLQILHIEKNSIEPRRYTEMLKATE